MKRLLATLFVAFLPLAVCAAPLQDHLAKLVPLIDPAKLATLAERGANPRLQKAVAILEDARRDSWPVTDVASNAVAMVYTNALLKDGKWVNAEKTQ
jgi:hypothetical protein